MVVACLQVTARGLGQSISLTLKEAPLEKVFKEIKKQTGYSFVYTRVQLNSTHSINCELKNVEIETALKIVLADQPITYVVEGHYVVIQSKDTSANSKTKPALTDVSGRIVNQDGDGIPGATVQAKGTSKTTTTDINGYFKLNGISPDDVLVVSAAEFESKEVKIKNQPFINIRVIQKVGNLDEALVIGYGTTTRRYGTGSVTKVNGDEILKQPITNPLAGLQGRVPGLVVTNTSGVPGSTVNIQVRGQNSINPNPIANRGVTPIDNPLIIVDGVPFAPQNSNINLLQSLASPGQLSIYGNPYGGISPLNSINPADIESIEVLRDASETAIYGSRGANGVIIITTRKGKQGKTTLGINYYKGQSSCTRTMGMMNTSEYLGMRREAFANLGITPDLNPSSPGYAPELLAFDSSRNIDWKKYFLGGRSDITNANIVVSGGSANTQFLLGAGYVRESYVLPGGFFNTRLSTNFNLKHRSSDNKLELEFSANRSYSANNSSGSPDLLKAFVLPPNYPELINSDGDINWSYNGVQLYGDAYGNPMGYIKRRYKGNNYNLISHTQVSYELLQGLRLKASLGYNSFLGNENSQQPLASYDPSVGVGSSADFATNDYRTWILEPQIHYKKQFSGGSLQLLFGSTLQKNINSRTQLNGQNYPDDNLLGSISAATIKSAADNYSSYKYAALFGRINYVLNQKYIVNINGRRDGSSRFGPGKQFGNFYSFGLGWIFSETKFVKSQLPWLSFGKLRGSYGITGNDNIGNYQYLSRWQAGTNLYNGTPGYIPQNLPNDEFSWSVNKKFELGLEMGAFENKVNLNLSWFRNRSGNQLVSYILPSQVGFNNVTANFPALVQNSGLEAQLTANPISQSSFAWNASVMVTIPRNKLVSFPGIETSSYSSIYIVGQSLSVYRGFQYAGVDPNSGYYLFNTTNGPTSSPSPSSDLYVLGNRDKKLFGGVSNKFTYKDITLELFVEFCNQKGLNFLRVINLGYQPGTSVNQPVLVSDRWRKPGDEAQFQKYDPIPGNQVAANLAGSSAAFSDASYIRLKFLSLSYRVPNKLLAKFRLSQCALFANCQNLATLTRYKGNDPETQSFYGIPPLKTIVVGIQANL
jgi:TonB-linked SusC/RagA family outer membrane protein